MHDAWPRYTAAIPAAITLMDQQLSLASPDGRLTVLTSPWEVRMSLWIETPSIVVNATGEVLFAFDDACWSLNCATWTAADQVTLRLRKYPGSHAPTEIGAEVDCTRKVARVGAAEVGLAQLESQLDAQLAWPDFTSPQRSGLGALSDWLQRLLGRTR